MEYQTNDISDGGFDSTSLATLIIELNIARRNSSAYPKGHPVIALSLAKVLRVYENLLEARNELVLGVTSDALMINGTVLEKSNLVYRDFSRALFERGIGALLFHRGLTIEELNNFTIVLGLKRDQIHKAGGIEEVWTKSGIIAIGIRPVRYDLFKTSDRDSVPGTDTLPSTEGLWDRFARAITVGGELHKDSGDMFLDPEVLAEILNHRFDNCNINEADVRGAISGFLEPADTTAYPAVDAGTQPFQKLGSFISNLAPELRRQFLDSSFGSTGVAKSSAAESLITNLSNTTIIETLEDISNKRLSVSPVVFGLLQRLGQNASASQHSMSDFSEEINLSQKMKTIFREHASEEFVPDDYQIKLNDIIASDQIPRAHMEEVTDLLKSLENRSIENSIGKVLMNLIREGIESPEEHDLFLQNMIDMFGFYLQTGDYAQLHTIIDQLSDDSLPNEIQLQLRDEYFRREFLEEILDGLVIWGKPRFEYIHSLIHKIGEPFVDPILDRLSEENSMSLRRFYMDSLIQMGHQTQILITNRLTDTRWYFLRNLLIILSAQNDPSIISLIRPLLRREDPRLRHEVLKTLVHLRDPQAEKQILEDLESTSTDLQLSAIQLAEYCNAPAIAVRLAAMLSQGGLSQADCERKSTIVHTLGEIGRAEVLPELAKILGSRSMLHARHLTKLKMDIVQSLPKYPVTVSRPILEHIAKDSGDVARRAEETLKLITGRQNDR